MSSLYYPSKERLQLQPLSALACVAANCHTALANLSCVDADRIGIVGHSYGGKHDLKFQDGPYWIGGGTDSPENFLAYAGFDTQTLTP